jgi:multidrug efflux system membrane fusion protein
VADQQARVEPGSAQPPALLLKDASAPAPVRPAHDRAGGARRRFAPALVTILLLAALVGLLWWWHPWGGAHRSMPVQPQAVRTAKVVTGDLPLLLNGLGTVTPLATVKPTLCR